VPACGAAAHDQADDHHYRHHQQADHHHRSEFLAETEVRGQGGQAKTGGETGQRAHPRTLGLGCRGARRGLRLGRGRRCGGWAPGYAGAAVVDFWR
jgi:hypothetical protein